MDNLTDDKYRSSKVVVWSGHNRLGQATVFKQLCGLIGRNTCALGLKKLSINITAMKKGDLLTMQM